MNQEKILEDIAVHVDRHFAEIKTQDDGRGYPEAIQKVLDEAPKHFGHPRSTACRFAKSELVSMLDFYRCPSCHSLDCDDGYCKG